MNFAEALRAIGRGSLDVQQAHDLFAAMLDDGVPDMELGALLLALRMQGETLDNLLGFECALAERTHRLSSPTTACLPVVLPCYNGARHKPNLTALLALLLREFGIPVALHGPLLGTGRVNTAVILRELGWMPATTLATARQQIARDGLVFVPTAVLSPGLAALLALRERLGVRSSAHVMAKLLQPFTDDCLRIVNVSHPAYLDRMRDFLSATNARALLLRGTEGEPFANPLRGSQLSLFADGKCQVLFEDEAGTIRQPPALPPDREAASTAAWIRQALARTVAIPAPLRNQLAACLYGCGYVKDFGQARVLVAGVLGHLLENA